METIAQIAIALSLLAVVVILLMGIWNMMRGGSGNLSQKLMRARVIAQAVALAIILGAFYFFGRGNGA